MGPYLFWIWRSVARSTRPWSHPAPDLCAAKVVDQTVRVWLLKWRESVYNGQKKRGRNEAYMRHFLGLRTIQVAAVQEACVASGCFLVGKGTKKSCVSVPSFKNAGENEVLNSPERFAPGSNSSVDLVGSMFMMVYSKVVVVVGRLCCKSWVGGCFQNDQVQTTDITRTRRLT